jgi:hypothetical protein
VGGGGAAADLSANACSSTENLGTCRDVTQDAGTGAGARCTPLAHTVSSSHLFPSDLLQPPRVSLPFNEQLAVLFRHEEGRNKGAVGKRLPLLLAAHFGRQVAVIDDVLVTVDVHAHLFRLLGRCALQHSTCSCVFFKRYAAALQGGGQT